MYSGWAFMIASCSLTSSIAVAALRVLFKAATPSGVRTALTTRKPFFASSAVWVTKLSSVDVGNVVPAFDVSYQTLPETRFVSAPTSPGCASGPASS